MTPKPPKPPKRRRGRPIGWRKKDPKSYSIMVRLTKAAIGWLKREANAADISKSEIVRQLIENSMGKGEK
jgi:hypothetical protein